MTQSVRIIIADESEITRRIARVLHERHLLINPEGSRDFAVHATTWDSDARAVVMAIRAPLRQTVISEDAGRMRRA